MSEELKEKILDFLISKPNEKFSITQISRKLGISYSTCLKWIEVLIGEKALKVEDWGNLKLVYYDRNKSR